MGLVGRSEHNCWWRSRQSWGSFEGNREDKDKSGRLREQGGANNGIVTQEGLGGGLWNLFHHGLWVQVEVWSSNEIGKSALDFPLLMCVLLVVWLHAVYEVRANEVWNSDASAAKGGPGGRMSFKTPHTTFFCGGSTQVKGQVVTNSTGKACPKFEVERGLAEVRHCPLPRGIKAETQVAADVWLFWIVGS